MLRFSPAVLSEPFTLSGETLIFLHCFDNQGLFYQPQKHFIDKVEFSGQSCGLKTSRVLPDPVVCHIYPPLSVVFQILPDKRF